VSSWPLGRVVLTVAVLTFCGAGFVISQGADVLVGAASVAIGLGLLLIAIKVASGRRGKR
jgi:hypothetical protein